MHKLINLLHFITSAGDILRAVRAYVRFLKRVDLK